MSKKKTGSNQEVIEANEQRLKEYADELNQLQTAIESSKALSIKHSKIALEFALKAGAILNDAKKIVPFGNWEKWVEDNVKAIEIRTAQNYMKLAEKAAETKNAAFFQAAGSLGEAYSNFGITEKKPKSKSDPNQTKGDMKPEQMKKKDMTRYDAKRKVARQSALAQVRKAIETTKKLNWDLSTWTVKNNKPCSGDGVNHGAALFNSMTDWIAKREFSSSLTYEDEVAIKAAIVLAEVVKTIILANTVTQNETTPEVEDSRSQFSMEVNPQPVEVAEPVPA